MFLPLVSALMLATAVSVEAQVVTTTNDFGAGSLRELIATAQAGATITFDPALSGKIIASTNGVFLLTRDVTIDGSGLPERAAIIVPDKGYASRGTNLITINPGVHVILRNLILSNVWWQGIRNDGDLSLENVKSTASGDWGVEPPLVAISSSGRLTIKNSQFPGNPTAILNTGDEVSISDSAFSSSGGFDPNYGVIENIRGNLALARTTFSNSYGLAIALRSGVLSMSECVIKNQPFSGQSEGLCIQGGNGVVTNCTFDGNSAENTDGGAIANRSDLRLTNCTFTGNRASGGRLGGAIFNARGATLIVDTCSFQTNGAPEAGAIYNQGNLTALKSMFQKNDGGAIKNGASAVCSVSDSTFLGNYCDGAVGGAVYNAGTLNLLRTVVQGNVAGLLEPPYGQGGGLYSATGTVTIASCQFIENIANAGGGILHGGGSMTISNSLFSGNTAGREGWGATGGVGGGINSWGDLLLVNSTLSENDAKIGTWLGDTPHPNGGYGGGISCSGKTIIRNCSFLKNLAGAVYEPGGSLWVENSTFASNSANPYFDSYRPYDYILIGQRAAGIFSAGSLAINSSTIVSNTCTGVASGPGGNPLAAGGVVSTGTFALTNSIVSKNSNAEGPRDVLGTVNGSNNFISGEPMLAAVGDYGGPTQTMLPLAGSPVIDAGGPTSLTTDQRGWARVAAAAVDIGAVEFGSIAGPPKIDFIRGGNSASLQLSFQGDKGLNYSIWSTGDISLPLNQWTLLGDATENTGAASSYSYTEAFEGTASTKFFSVRVQ